MPSIELTTASESQINAIRSSLKAVGLSGNELINGAKIFSSSLSASTLSSSTAFFSTINAGTILSGGVNLSQAFSASINAVNIPELYQVYSLVRNSSAFWFNNDSIPDPLFETDLTYEGSYPISVEKDYISNGFSIGELKDFANTSSPMSSGGYISIRFPIAFPTNANSYFMNIKKVYRLLDSRLAFYTLTGFSMPDVAEINRSEISFSTQYSLDGIRLNELRFDNLESIYNSSLITAPAAVSQLRELNFPKLKSLVGSKIVIGGYMTGGTNLVTILSAVKFPSLIYCDQIAIGSNSINSNFFPFNATPLSGVRVLDFSNLEFLNYLSFIRLDGVERFHFPKLKTIGLLLFTPSMKLSSINLPELENIVNVGGYTGGGLLIQNPVSLTPVLPLTGVHMPKLKSMISFSPFEGFSLAPFLTTLEMGTDTLQTVDISTLFLNAHPNAGLSRTSVDNIFKALSRTVDNNNCRIGGYVTMTAPNASPSFTGTIKSIANDSILGDIYDLNTNFDIITAIIPNHGYSVGNYVTITTTSKTPFFNPDGSYPIFNVLDNNRFTYLIGGYRGSQVVVPRIAGNGNCYHTTNNTDGFYYFQNVAYKTGRTISINLPTI